VVPRWYNIEDQILGKTATKNKAHKDRKSHRTFCNLDENFDCSEVKGFVHNAGNIFIVETFRPKLVINFSFVRLTLPIKKLRVKFR
jgi:hypothetical protein